MIAAPKKEVDWKKVAGGISDTCMQVEAVPAHCQWSNVGAERAIQIDKRTLRKKYTCGMTISLLSTTDRPGSPGCCLMSKEWTEL